MTPEQIGAILTRTAQEWPVGSIVWHKANGKRGVVTQYSIDGAGCILLEVDFGNGQWEKTFINSLSSEVIPKDDDDSWKQSA